MLNLLPSFLVLGPAALVAAFLAVNRPSPPENSADRHTVSRALALATAIQVMHFTEEALTGFNQQLPALFGLPVIPFSGFMIFNLGWIVIWLASIPAIRSPSRPAFFAAWFLAIAGMFNGVLHPLLAIAQGGYFPGLLTSPIAGTASLWLWLKLRKVTAAKRP